ncbi:hypothetical protein K466DRAFT_596432 [Polyporus arcularius HHB13444]|uniref:Uncharacterized protein n=1 Tax=Polyporus arcularius HHB13444 TaxID=1314778 RepID=A0A5C3PNF4_9APHY|nr:hypothetical protein K466DRAFT_596432 [Polyporus arcularius HHB13444]
MEVEVSRRAKDGKMQAQMVYETTVDEGACSSTVFLMLAGALDKPTNFVSQGLRTIFHAPAPAGSKLEIVNTTVAFDGRTV